MVTWEVPLGRAAPTRRARLSRGVRQGTGAKDRQANDTCYMRTACQLVYSLKRPHFSRRFRTVPILYQMSIHLRHSAWLYYSTRTATRTTCARGSLTGCSQFWSLLRRQGRKGGMAWQRKCMPEGGVQHGEGKQGSSQHPRPCGLYVVLHTSFCKAESQFELPPPPHGEFDCTEPVLYVKKVIVRCLSSISAGIDPRPHLHYLTRTRP